MNKNFYLRVIVFFFLMVSINTLAFATPEVKIAQKNITTGSNQAELSILISDIADANIGGYILRLDYDDSIFTNPTVITANSLSQGLTVEGAVPVDGFGGKYSIGLMSGFTATNDGTLIKVLFEISSEFDTEDITFVTAKTQLHTLLFVPVEASYVNGSITIQEITDDPFTASVPTLNEYGILFFMMILMLSSFNRMRNQARQNI
ncbi:MAG: hypothetical protein HQK75_05575 [Candidatus Magnetomorum sp.]|nr:hypothetical protein [Candidatus Magnetomorum sp.]